MAEAKAGVFSAQLKYWRLRRGLSQLDLAIAADVSPRHVSFLETGRARPSDEMVQRLASTLSLNMRDHNQLLCAAGFEPIFSEPPLAASLDSPVGQALSRMLAQHEPYPMVVFDGAFDVVQSNRGATALLAAFVPPAYVADGRLNILRILFEPAGVRGFVRDWARVARGLLSRLQVEALARPHDERLQALLDDILALPDIPDDWRRPDFTHTSEPTLALRLVKDELELSFLTAVTVFSSPNNITLEELRIESYFPLDDATAKACERLCR